MHARKRLRPEVDRSLRAILVRAKKEKRRAIEKTSAFLSNPEQSVGRTIEGKGHSDEVSDGNEEYMLQDNGGKAIFIIKRQKTWLNCVHLRVLVSNCE